MTSASGSPTSEGRVWHARVVIKPRQGILDPQGKAIFSALVSLGFTGVGEVRAGKVIDITLVEADAERARLVVAGMCEKLLANPVVEDFDILIT